MFPFNHKKVRLKNLIPLYLMFSKDVKYQIFQEDSFGSAARFVTVFLPSFFDWTGNPEKEDPRRKGDESIFSSTCINSKYYNIT